MRAINVLQGSYAPPATLGNRVEQWRLPIALAAATVLVFVLGQAIGLWKMNAPSGNSTCRRGDVRADAARPEDVDARSQVEGMLRGAVAAARLLAGDSQLAQAVASARRPMSCR